MAIWGRPSRRCRCSAAVIDGEIVVQDARGVSRFAALQQALSEGAGNRLVFFAFDLVHLNGWDLSAVALERRKGLLRAAAGRAGRPVGDPVQRPRRRRRAGVLRPGVGDGAGRGGVQARLGAVPAGALEDLDQGQGAPDRRFRDRGLYGVGGGGGPRGAGARRVARRRTALCRQGGDRVRQRHVAAVAGAAGASARRRRCHRRGAEGHGLGAAGTVGADQLCHAHGGQRAAACGVQGPQGGRNGRNQGRSAAQAADLGGGPRHRDDHQPGAAAVRAQRADQARHRGLLCRDRRRDAAAYPGAAGVAGALPDRAGEGLLLPAPCLHRHAGVDGGVPDRDLGGRDQELHQRRGRQGLPGAGAVRGGRVPHLGGDGDVARDARTGWSSTSIRGRGSAGGRWSRRRCRCATSSRRWGSWGS